MRLSEACRLTTDDVDLVNGILTIRETKFRKSRLVPLHPTTTQALARYADHKILALATYLGHARVTDTYWYCTAVPELLASTSQRFERFAHRASERRS